MRRARPQPRPPSASAIRSRSERRTDDVIRRCPPFGLERTIDGARSYLFFPGIEADCGTEPIDASDSDRSSIAKKFAAYMAIAEQGIHRSHFGFPNFFVPFITTTTARLRRMMELLGAPDRRSRLQDVSVQDLSELHVAGEPAAAERPHAHRAVAAGRLPAAPSRSLNVMDRRQNIIALNDQLRTTFKGGRVQMTPQRL